MKRSLLSLFLALFSWSTASSQESLFDGKLRFKELAFSFDSIDFRGKARHDFWFTNTGSDTLSIRDVTAECGCTKPEWPKMPLKPGASAIVGVKYDTSREGPFNKSVKVYFHGLAEPVELYVNGVVRRRDQTEWWLKGQMPPDSEN